ncbi:response regulator receiver protein [Halothece sp. PCC 7418]|uniref:response regulator n=1 Tax=Halothece sp. (strain PCC 7418) TaxID=65093 RepID=UPI0002A069EC|nr:response regulator [Halothece sp. PCC 7418]AFZ42844.1 response regulator receiver protein [Halothece sp. PCC 7418]
MEHQFLSSIMAYAHRDQTGCLEIQNLKHQQQSWFLYFRLGRLFWAGGGEQEQRRIYRQLVKQMPQDAVKLLQLREEVNWNAESAYYDFIVYLFQQEKISLEQLIAIKNDIILEVLFDLLQVDEQQNQQNHTYGQNSSLYWQWHENYRPKNYVPIAREVAKSSEELVATAKQNWQRWQNANLNSCSPNQAPVMIDPEKIRASTAAKTFQNLQRLVTGKRSLREIAISTKCDLVPVTKALWEYYQQGWLQWQELQDLDWESIAPKRKPQLPTEETSGKEKYLIACVDDSVQVTETLKAIVQEKGHSFMGINDPLRATATLLKAKPDLIFLDLIMPNTNGYEICTQLRRVSSLKEIPIVILTGKDGLIDRMRAKMAGATQYVSKPVQGQIILEVMEKYLPMFLSNQESEAVFASSVSSSVQV